MKRKLEIGLKLDNNQTLYIILSQAAAYKPLNVSSNIVGPIVPQMSLKNTNKWEDIIGRARSE